MSRTGAEIRASETQSKFIQDRITKVEKHFGEFCEHIAGFSRKLSKLRDKGDEVSTAIMSYAENESHNPSTKMALTQFSENFSAVQDYREAEIRRLDDKVVAPLTTYGQSCKVAKERLKNAFAARKKEISQQEKLSKVKDKAPSDRHTISQAETDLQRAGVDAARSSRSLEDEMDSFEKKKLQDIKTMLQDFVNIEIIYHAKALEMYTLCYQNLQEMHEEEDLERMLQDFVNIELIYHAKALEMYTVCYGNLADMDEGEDLEEFRNSLRPHNSTARIELQRAHSKTSLNSTSGMNGTAQSRGTTPAAARRNVLAETGNTTGKSSMYSEDYGTTTMSGTVTSTTFTDATTTLQQNDDEDDDEEEEETDSEDEDEDDDYARRFRPTTSPPQPPPRPPSAPVTPTRRPPTHRR